MENQNQYTFCRTTLIIIKADVRMSNKTNSLYFKIALIIKMYVLIYYVIKSCVVIFFWVILSDLGALLDGLGRDSGRVFQECSWGLGDFRGF